MILHNHILIIILKLQEEDEERLLQEFLDETFDESFNKIDLNKKEDSFFENTQKRLDFLIEKANFKFYVFVKVYFFNCHFYYKLSFELKSSDNGTELNLLNDKVSSINSFSGVGEFIFDLVDDDFNPLPIKAKNKKQYRENINKLRFLEDEKFKEFINNVDKYILNKKLNEKLNTKEVKVKKIKI